MVIKKIFVYNIMYTWNISALWIYVFLKLYFRRNSMLQNLKVKKQYFVTDIIYKFSNCFKNIVRERCRQFRKNAFCIQNCELWHDALLPLIDRNQSKIVMLLNWYIKLKVRAREQNTLYSVPIFYKSICHVNNVFSEHCSAPNVTTSMDILS